MAQKKFYAVKNGKKTGIFTTWAECEENVKSVKGAVYKSFPTKTEAEEFLGLKSESEEEKIIPPKDTAYAYVDGSFNINTSIYGYAFTATELDRCPFIGTHPTDKSRINILMAHGEIGKSVSIKCPIPNEAISETGYDYVALGHYHDFSGIKQLGSSYYAYCGCLEGRGFDERGDKGAIIGIAEKELETGKFNLGAKFIRFSKRRYESEKLDISGCRTNADVVGRLAELISEKKYGEDTALRVKLTGSVAGELRISEEFISAQFPQLFLLRLNDETLPLLDADQLSRDPTIRGAFYETLRPMLESADENERELAASALRYGLAAISGGDVADF